MGQVTATVTGREIPPPGSAQALIQTDDGSFLVALGDGPAEITDGYGGWEEVERPNDVSLTEWVGQAPLRMTLPVLLDGFANRESVQRDLNRVLKLGRTKDGDEAPEPFKLTGPVPFSGEKWVMESTPDFGETIRSRNGKLLRQALTLNLMQYVKPDRAKIKKRKRAADTYTTKAGDTILKIVAKFHPAASRDKLRDFAHDVAKANGIRDIRKRLEPGTKIKLT